jgi:hypothetical protein
MNMPDLEMTSHSELQPAKIFINLGKQTGHKCFDVKSDIVVETGHYHPDFNFTQKKLTGGFTNMKKYVSRKRLPSGRPNPAPNLVKVKLLNGEAVDPEKVLSGYSSLAHIQPQLNVPNFKRMLPRDDRSFFQDDRVRNILQDN